MSIINCAQIEEGVRLILEAIGMDPNRYLLIDNPMIFCQGGGTP